MVCVCIAVYVCSCSSDLVQRFMYGCLNDELGLLLLRKNIFNEGRKRVKKVEYRGVCMLYWNGMYVYQ